MFMAALGALMLLTTALALVFAIKSGGVLFEVSNLIDANRLQEVPVGNFGSAVTCSIDDEGWVALSRPAKRYHCTVALDSVRQLLT